MNIYASTRKGIIKTHSEDRIVIDDIVLNDENRRFENISPKIVGVSDGVGGNEGGEIAAQYICERALSLTEGDILQNAEDINNSLLSYASGIEGKEEMAATFSAVVYRESMQFFHIGNTRIYSVQGKYLKQLTDDHTTYNYLMTCGLLEEAAQCNKNEIIACFGSGNIDLFTPDNETFNAGKIVMTSDGIHDHIDIDVMEEIICSDKSDEEKCSELMQTALDNGSYDDMSIIIIS